MSDSTQPKAAICEECGGTGVVGSVDRYTDHLPGAGEVQWRGYMPTNLCFACMGAGVWPPPASRKGAK